VSNSAVLNEQDNVYETLYFTNFCGVRLTASAVEQVVPTVTLSEPLENNASVQATLTLVGLSAIYAALSL